ncbi:MAG: Prephenate dehydratase [uncultured Nocardioidaceae bacterium]|uniref:Prephenate dehydratase n=1 Tax=uncultured Nocardioidaceae bacterium TaxID=253824 RepID=A0A6J4LHF2_9ACTN|nr:MAG: Prephenate dehydratase [uncultured Nocardioidaceae bacterium]
MPDDASTRGPRYSYLGPEGTFTEQALRTLPDAATAVLEPCSTVTVALDAVRSGTADGAVVPIENSVEGSVPVTLDELAQGEPLMITREMTVPVAFSLLVRPGTALSDVRRVGTHPHAAAQTRTWLAEHLPGAEVVHASSTAQAAARLAVPDAAGPAPWDAAVSAPLAAERYALEVLARGIGDNPDAVTRFVLVTRPGPPTPPTGRDKTSLVAFMHEDHPGALLEILEQLTVRGVNLTRIESRPTGAALGDYCFSIDAEGHVLDQRVGEALAGLRRVCADVRFLGSYERHDGKAPRLRPGTTDEEFEEAAAWLARLRSGG